MVLRANGFGLKKTDGPGEPPPVLHSCASTQGGGYNCCAEIVAMGFAARAMKPDPTGAGTATVLPTFGQ
jgi:hypothetical protein